MKIVNKEIKIGELNKEHQSMKSAREAIRNLVKIDDKYIQYTKAESENVQLLECRMHPFVQAVHEAYSNHLPLNISPDMIWYLIASATAAHINANAEELRYKFVDHEGKKRIKVRRDDFIIDSTSNPWNEVVDEFCQKLGENTKTEVADTMQANFSTTTKDARVVSQIVLMDAMQKYFEYYFSTLCGIPEINVSGTKDDWIKLKAKTEAIVNIIPEFRDWMDKSLGNILDNFIKIFDNQIDDLFWNQIYKMIDPGSGGPFITGWILALFPYLKDGEKNRYVWESNWQDSLPKDNQDMFGVGLTTDCFGYHMNQVPFIWNYHGQEIKMLFIGGFVGVLYDEEKDHSVTPLFGYAVTEDKVQLKSK